MSSYATESAVPLPPILGGPGAFKPVLAPAVKPTVPANTAKLEPASTAKRGTSQRFYTPPPGRAGSKPDGYEAITPGPRGRASIGAKTQSRPYWLASRGTGGNAGLAGWSPAQRQIVAKEHAANTTVAGNVLAAAVHPVTDLGQAIAGQRHITTGGAVSDLANIASNLIPAGKVGAAGLFGLRGLKALKDAKVVKETVDAAQVAKDATEVAPDAKTALQGTLKGARNVRGKQEAGYSAERSARFQAANAHLTNQDLAPADRLALAKNELKGELPKIDFQGMKVLDENAVKELQAHILDHPHLMPGQKIRAADALTNAMAGKVPTKGELTLLEHVFGKQTAVSLGGIAKHPFKDTLLSVMNVPRSLMASFDLSAPFRQGLAVATSHPTIFARNFKPMVKAFGNEGVYHAMLSEIRARPTFPMMMEAKLSLTELGSEVGAREEQFASDLAEKIPLAGRGVRMSGRAYTGFLDKTRADVFDHLIGRAQQQGINVQDQKFLEDLGRFVNSATGRGPLGNLQGAAPALNAVFFSPRLLASRLDLIFSPVTYARADPFVRQEAIRSMVQLAGTASTLLALVSQVPGVKVVLDPRNPDWGKIKIGNTRVDIGGGFQQPLRLFAQLATGVAISSTTGKRLDLTTTGFGKPNRLDLFLRFFEGKESPIASMATDWARNSSQIGQKFSLKTEVAQHLIPLLAQDSYDLYKAHHGGMNGLAAAFVGYGVGSVGLGLQTYGPKPSKPPGASGGNSPYSAPSSSSGSPYGVASSSGGSAYAP